MTFLITAAAFGSLSLVGYTTKNDLTGFGSFLIMGLSGLIIASVVNIFLALSALAFVVNVDRRADLRRPDRLRHPAAEDDLLPARRRPGGDGRGHQLRRAQPLPGLPQPLPLPAAAVSAAAARRLASERTIGPGGRPPGLLFAIEPPCRGMAIRLLRAASTASWCALAGARLPGLPHAAAAARRRLGAARLRRRDVAGPRLGSAPAGLRRRNGLCGPRADAIVAAFADAAPPTFLGALSAWPTGRIRATPGARGDIRHGLEVWTLDACAAPPVRRSNPTSRATTWPGWALPNSGCLG